MDIEFIKWMCDKAEGFELSNSFYNPSLRLEIKYLYWDNCGAHENPEMFYIENHPIRKMLLQGAIEGVNNNQRKYDIRYTSNTIKIFDEESSEPSADYWRFAEIDQAKEAALKYIYEQDKK